MSKERLGFEESTFIDVCSLFKKKFELHHGLLIKDVYFYKKVESEEFLPYLVKQFNLKTSMRASTMDGLSSVFEFFSETCKSKSHPYFSISISEIPQMKGCILYLFYSEEDVNAHIDYLVRTKTDETRHILSSGYTYILKVTL